MGRTKPLLTAQHILEKEFRIDTKGYRMSEVDVFLDAVNSDYRMFEDRMNRLIRALSEERQKNMLLEKEVARLRDRVNISDETSANDYTQSSSVDLLKRLSELEKLVYKSDK